jgi:chromosome partitioning protein
MSQLLTVEDVATRLNVHPETVRGYLRRGEMNGSNRGGRTGWRIKEEDFQIFLAIPPLGATPAQCRVIAVTNQKGGVGKTTTVANVGHALAARGKRVLLVDVDPQANLTLGLGVAEQAEQKNIVAVLRNEDRGLASLTVETKTPNLYIVPSHIDLANAEQLSAGRFSRERIIRDAITEQLKLEFDYILLDSPPNFGLLSDNCMVAADEVIIPVAAHYYAVQGMSALLERLRMVQKHLNPNLRVLGLVATRYDSRALLCKEVVARLPSYKQPVFKTIISEAIKVAEAPAWSQTILDFRPDSESSAQHHDLAAEIEGNEVQVLGERQ